MLAEILTAAEKQTGKYINCGFSAEQVEQLEQIFPTIPPSACHRLDSLVYFWRMERDDTENDTSPVEARKNTQKLSQALKSTADSLDKLLANRVAESYTTNDYNVLVNAVSVMRTAEVVLVNRLQQIRRQYGRAGRRNEYAEIFTAQAQHILDMDGLSLIYFDQNFQKFRPRIELLEFLCECAAFRKLEDGEPENLKYGGLIDKLKLQ
ncbi:hypothetical protein [Methylobacterium sp. J-077]|uniref:hypothetical protein n=1 Tax=Methylobacterium sp. J-077 TaxID=2836656 RepID=UPI001FBB3553|nr:hypothetical protein [Methylobacterium sp. J-077]MCJ2122407.1 hypothetical protein [Methylobacterium sp. J-077]